MPLNRTLKCSLGFLIFLCCVFNNQAVSSLNALSEWTGLSDKIPLSQRMYLNPDNTYEICYMYEKKFKNETVQGKDLINFLKTIPKPWDIASITSPQGVLLYESD